MLQMLVGRLEKAPGCKYVRGRGYSKEGVTFGETCFTKRALLMRTVVQKMVGRLERVLSGDGPDFLGRAFLPICQPPPTATSWIAAPF
jgi:hypothetical protein